MGARYDGVGGPAHWRMGPEGPEPRPNEGEGTGPCCDKPRWPACRDCAHYPAGAKLEHMMEDARPYGAPELRQLGDPLSVEECQTAAFIAGDEDWWRMGAGFALFEKTDYGAWIEVRDLEDEDGECEEEAGEVACKDAEPVGDVMGAADEPPVAEEVEELGEDAPRSCPRITVL